MSGAGAEFTGSPPLRAITNFSAVSAYWQFCRAVTSSVLAAWQANIGGLTLLEITDAAEAALPT